MRILLNTIQDRDWLTQEAEVGRGKRSRLIFLYTGLAPQQQRAEDLLEQDRIDQLAQLAGGKAIAWQMLVSHLSHSFRQGRHILRVLYYRPLRNLLPGSTLRCSEAHIARQISSPLTRINEENGELEADIAHHWQQISPLHWRFFLRPGVHFHHGRELEMDDMIASLKRTNTLPLYSHIVDIAPPTPWMLDIHLTQSDRWLPLLLGQAPVVILPREWGTPSNFTSHPIGTGPYAVVRDSTNQLKIQAFDDFFGYRASIDKVNVWALPEIADELTGGLTLEGPQGKEKEIESRLEEGRYYLLFDSRTHRGVNQQVRDWVSYVPSPTNLVYFTGEQCQQLWFPAYGLFPRWCRARTVKSEKLADLESFILTFYQDHSGHRVIVGIMQQILASYQVTLKIKKIDYDQQHTGGIESDIWLNSANFTLPLDFPVLAHLYEVPLLQYCIPIDWQADVVRWRNGEMNLVNWCRQLVASKAMMLLLHYWLITQGQRSMRGLRMSTLGRFDFKLARFVPPDP